MPTGMVHLDVSEWLHEPTSFMHTSFKGLKMPPVMPLPPPPASAAAQWAQHAYTASTQAAAARAAASKAAEVASAQAAAAQAAATQAQVAQVSAQQAAAAQVAQSLGYNVAPVGVPTAAAYGDMPSAAPPYGLSTPNPAPPPGLGPGPAVMSSMGEAALLQILASLSGIAPQVCMSEFSETAGVHAPQEAGDLQQSSDSSDLGRDARAMRNERRREFLA
mmetsp:Transcript_33836/g.77229  ORF Transcript_33836/g.77229 Transcript_33836/m.77229 type:complete len:219 (+) Transcript_33836:53-709(+)